MVQVAAGAVLPMMQNVAGLKEQGIANEQAQIEHAERMQNLAAQKRNLNAAEAKSEVEAMQKKAELAYGKLDFAGRLLATAKDDKSLSRAKEQYLTVYPEDRANIEKYIPAKFDRDYIDQVKRQLRSMSDTLKPLTVKEGEKILDPISHEVIAAGEKKPTDEFGEPYIDKATGALMQKNIGTGKINKIAAPPKGMVIESDGAGGFSMRTGVSTGADMTKKTQGAIESKLLGGQEQLARMEKIYADFKPEYQELGSRAGRAWTSLKAKAGVKIPKEEADALNDYKRFQRKAIENINLYIKELTGAQMSEKEADRLRLAQPDPGEKWYLGDDPITFRGKMDDVLGMTRAAVSRYENYKSKGLSDSEIKGIIKSDSGKSLDSFMTKTQKNIDDRGDELSAQGMSDEEVINTLKAEGYF